MAMFQDTQYFSDSEHQLLTGGSSLMARQEMRRLRNRTLSGLDSVRSALVGAGLGSAGAGGGGGGLMVGLSGHLGGVGGNLDHQHPLLHRPGSASGIIGMGLGLGIGGGGGSRPITPSFANDKDAGQQFIDFNPAGEEWWASSGLRNHRMLGRL